MTTVSGLYLPEPPPDDQVPLQTVPPSQGGSFATCDFWETVQVTVVVGRSDDGRLWTLGPM